MAKSESSALGMKDGRSALEALGLKRAMEATEMALRWVHSEAQIADCMTKNSPKAVGLMEHFLHRQTWRLVHDDQFQSARNRRKKGLDILEQEGPDAAKHHKALDSDWDYIKDKINPVYLEPDEDGRAIFEDIGNPDIKEMIRVGT